MSRKEEREKFRLGGRNLENKIRVSLLISKFGSYHRSRSIEVQRGNSYS